MAAELVIAAAQMTSIDDVDANVMQIEALLESIFSRRESSDQPRRESSDQFEADEPRLVCFPENCLYFRIIEGEKIEGFTLAHPALKRMAELAREYSTHLHLGSIPLYIDGHLYNSSVLVTPDGDLLPTYQKMHLFDIQLEGQKAIRESDVFRHGQQPHVLNIDGWKIGEAICYDLRFAELFSKYARQEVDAILLPSAFLVKTGEAHWEVLLRARAIESQSYLIASAQGGSHKGGRSGMRETYGHTLIVDPWGVVAGQVEKRAPGFTIAKLSRDRIESVRKQIPMKFHRRLPIV